MLTSSFREEAFVDDIELTGEGVIKPYLRGLELKSLPTSKPKRFGVRRCVAILSQGHFLTLARLVTLLLYQDLFCVACTFSLFSFYFE